MWDVILKKLNVKCNAQPVMLHIKEKKRGKKKKKEKKKKKRSKIQGCPPNFVSIGWLVEVFIWNLTLGKIHTK